MGLLLLHILHTQLHIVLKAAPLVGLELGVFVCLMNFYLSPDSVPAYKMSDVQVCHQRLSSAFDFLLIFLRPLI